MLHNHNSDTTVQLNLDLIVKRVWGLFSAHIVIFAAFFDGKCVQQEIQ